MIYSNNVTIASDYSIYEKKSIPFSGIANLTIVGLNASKKTEIEQALYLNTCSSIQPVDSELATVSIVGHLQHNFPSFVVIIRGTNLGKVDCNKMPTIVAALQNRPMLRKDSYFTINDSKHQFCKEGEHISDMLLEFHCECPQCQYILILFSEHQILHNPSICEINVQPDMGCTFGYGV